MNRIIETRKQAGAHRGFTLMELLVVLAILGLLMSLVGPRVLNQLGGAKTKTAAIQIKDLEQALDWVANNASAYNIVSVNMSLGFGVNDWEPMVPLGMRLY